MSINKIDLSPSYYVELSSCAEKVSTGVCMVFALICIVGIIVSYYTVLGKIGMYVGAGGTAAAVFTALTIFAISTFKHVKEIKEVEQDLQRDEPALCGASRCGNLRLAEFLIRKGADIDETGGAWDTPLTLACYFGHQEIAKLLIEKGADINKQSSYTLDSPLHSACRKANIVLVELLLQKGANPNLVDVNGMTPLHLSVQTDNFQLVQLLLKNKADKTIKDTAGRTAYAWAGFSTHKDLQNLLFTGD